MADEHYPEDALLAFLDDNDAVVDLEAVRSHVAHCGACAATVADLRQWSTFFSQPFVWEDGPQADVDVPVALTNLGARRVASEAAAAALLATLPPTAVDTWEAAIATRPDLRDAGLATRLIYEARQRLNSTPANALVILAFALQVLTEVVPPDLRLEADAWKERANALRLTGRYQEALAALDEAERRYGMFPASAYDLAFVDWSRATVFWAMKRFADARSFLAQAAQSFESHEDEARLAQVRILEGSIRFDEGDIEGARQVFLRTLPLVESIGDDESLARALANLSGCEVRLGFFVEAKEHAATAAVLYTDLNMGAESVRLYWSLGEALSASGREEEALTALRAAAARFEELDMLGEVAEVGLDTAELLTRRGEFSEAAALSTRLFSYFRREGADVDAAHALDYLQRAIRTNHASPTLFAYLRSYIHARLDGQSVSFEPPPSIH